MKKLIVFFLILASSFVIFPSLVVQAEEKSEIEKLEEEVNKEVENYDFDKLNELLSAEEFKLTSEDDFKEIVTSLINGNYNFNTSGVLNKIIDLLFENIKSLVPLIVMILCIAILCNIITSFKPSEGSKSISELVHFVCITVVIVLLVVVIKDSYLLTKSTVDKITNQMTVLFPILLTLMTVTGSVVSVGIYQPIVAILTNGVTFIFTKLVYPIFLLSFIFVVLNSLSSDLKLNKFISFLSSSFKWIVGFVFTLFAGIMTIQGVSAGKYDTISLKATRFAVKSYIPIIGGYLSDGLDYVMLSSILIKNAVGVAGLLLLISSVLVPILNLAILKLGLQFIAGVVDPIGNSKISNLCEDLSKILIYPIVVILAISFMYLLSVGLIMCTVSGV